MEHDDSFVEDVRGWTVNVLRQVTMGPNVSRLLRKVAHSIDELGDIEVVDVTFCLEVKGEAAWVFWRLLRLDFQERMEPCRTTR